VGYLKPIACVLFFSSLFALLALGATAGEDRWRWAGMVEGLVGIWFGSVVVGVTTGGKLLDAIHPPGDESGGADP